jgi:DNA-directed RNA polymerase specialized sigma24 family protein
LLLRQSDRFDPSRGQLRSFLFGVARNLARKWLRDQNRWNALCDDQFIVEPVDMESRELAEVVGTAVQSLSPLQREVLLLA